MRRTQLCVTGEQAAVGLEGGMRAAEKGHVARLLNSVQLIPVTEVIAVRAAAATALKPAQP